MPKVYNYNGITILPTELENQDENQRTGNSDFNTEDQVYIYSYGEIDKQYPRVFDRITYATDYAVMCGASLSSQTSRLSSQLYGLKNKKATCIWCRSASGGDMFADSVEFSGYPKTIYANNTCVAYRLTWHVDFASFISDQSVARIYESENRYGNIHLATVGLKYPKTYVGKKLDKELNSLKKDGKLKKTGVKYTGFMRNDGSFVQNEEYEYNGEQYVLVEVNKFDDNSEFEDGTECPRTGNFTWAKVEPISCIITNWDKLPKSINPNGDGSAKDVELLTEDGIIAGLPFDLPFYSTDNKYSMMAMWQNSPVRAYLNGYNLNEEILNGNGNKQFMPPRNFNFKGTGFLYEASRGLGYELEVKNNTIESKKETKPNPYGFTFEELNNDELMNLYVSSNAPILLHGPSGVGKSQRVYQIDPNATRITLKKGQNYEEIMGVLNREKGVTDPPYWFVTLCEKCKAEPDKKHILFIDELMNVPPTIQSLVYDIVLDRSCNGGMWVLPDNAVVVAAGNEQNISAAYPLTEALFRRFSHIYYEIEKNDWLDWATGVSKIKTLNYVKSDKTPRAKIHPAIVAYIKSRDKDVLNQDFDEENPKIVTDPRKWEIASNILYTTKNPRALKPAIGEDLTEDFVYFVQNINLTVEDVVSGNYERNKFKEMNISQKLSTIVGLCMASEKELPIVREFVSSTMGKEVLATYDLLWIRNDPERAEIIAECNLNMIKEGKDNGLKY